VAQNRRKLLVRSFRFVYSRACGTIAGASLAASSSPDMASSLTDATFDPRPALPISNPSFRSSDDPPAAAVVGLPGRRAFETDNPGFPPGGRHFARSHPRFQYADDPSCPKIFIPAFFDRPSGQADDT
jgi:hypothetical protein